MKHTGGREHDNRTFRHFEATTEHTVRASLDSTGLSWGSMRLQYEHGKRTGQGLDEEVFSDPFRFDVARRPNRHVAFGAGPHTCIGAGVARLALGTRFCWYAGAG